MSGEQPAAASPSSFRAFPGSAFGSLARSLATILGALLIVAVLGLLLIATPQGSAWLIGEISALAGDRLTVTAVRGIEGAA